MKKTKKYGQYLAIYPKMNKNKLSNQFSYSEELDSEYDHWQPHVGKRNRRDHNDRQDKKKIRKFTQSD